MEQQKTEQNNQLEAQRFVRDFFRRMLPEDQAEKFLKYAWFKEITPVQMLEIGIGVLDGLADESLEKMAAAAASGKSQETLRDIRYQIVREQLLPQMQLEQYSHLEKDILALQQTLESYDIPGNIAELNKLQSDIAGAIGRLPDARTYNALSESIKAITKQVESDSDQDNRNLLREILQNQQNLQCAVMSYCKREPAERSQLLKLSDTSTEESKKGNVFTAFWNRIHSWIYRCSRKYRLIEKEKSELIAHICTQNLDEEQMDIIAMAVNHPQISLQDIQVIADERVPAEIMCAKFELLLQIHAAKNGEEVK